MATLTIDLPVEVETQLRETAARHGLTLADYARAALEEIARLAAIDAAYGALADLPFTVDDFLREKHEEAEREAQRDQNWLKP